MNKATGRGQRRRRLHHDATCMTPKQVEGYVGVYRCAKMRGQDATYQPRADAFSTNCNWSIVTSSILADEYPVGEL